MTNQISFIKRLSCSLFFLFLSNLAWSQFTTNGTATNLGNGCFQMTTLSPGQVGTIFSINTINLNQPFMESGTFNFGNIDANGADGITFLFTTSNTAMGQSGGGIGYEGITPSFVVEYDTWVNGPGSNNDPSSDHVGIQQNGNPTHNSANQLVAPINYPNLENGQEHCFTIDWNPTTQVFNMTLDNTTITYNGSIAAVMGTSNVYYGFTASTGGSFNNHTICFSTSTLTPMQDITICEGETVPLQADPNGATYNWTFDPTLSSTNIGNPTATPTTTTTYTVDIGYDCGQMQTDDVTVTVIPPPTTSVSNNGPLCEGETLNLMASGGSSYSWSGPSGYTSNQQNPSITNIQLFQAGIYSVIITDSGTGCSTVDFTTVNVLLPNPAVILSPEVYCQGDGLIQLMAIPTGGTWGGAADNNGFINTDNLPSGLNTVTYNAVDAQGCSISTELDINIQANPPPIITPIGSLCEGSDLILEGSNPGAVYIWSGPDNFSSTQQNPVITDLTLLSAGAYVLTVIQANGCFASASIDLQIMLGPTVIIDPVPFPICQSDGLLQMNATPFGGTWGGAANANGQIDPTQFTTGTYSVTYTFDDGIGCIGMDEVFVDIAENPMVSIDMAGPFCDSDPIQTLTGNPAGGIWGGVADGNGDIDPSDLGVGTFNITYEFTDNNGCFGETMTTVEILAGTSPTIDSSDPFCQSDDPETLIGTPTGGTWGGVADASGTITPANLLPGFHEVTYSVMPQGGCSGDVSIFIEIFENPTAVISGMGTICMGNNDEVELTIETSGAAPIEVTYAIDGTTQPSVQFSEGMNPFPVNDAGEYTIVSVVDNNGCQGIGSGLAMVEVVDAPLIINFETICDPAQENYFVIFEIIDGDPDSYDVSSSIGGNLSDNPPYVFTSDDIPSGNPYNFLIDDANGCNPTNLMGSFSCLCTTDAGTMNTAPLAACEDEMITVTFNNDETLDANDTLIFILHDGNGNSLGTIFDENTGLTVELLPNMMPGVTYYVSAVAGNNNGMGGVDLTDDCLSISFGTPVSWQVLPNGILLNDAAICAGEAATLTFNLTGNGPFDVIYSDGNQNDTLINILNGHSITVMPLNTTTYELIEISDNNTPSCQNTLSSSVTIAINPNFSTMEMAVICEGESIFLGGELQMEAGVYTDILNTQFGCDSIIITTLVVNEIDTIFQTDTDCNMANVGIFTNIFTNFNNCDSIVILTVTFSDTDTSLVNTPTCDPNEVGIETTIFTTPQGCDSTVIETFFLVESDTTELFDTDCNLASVGVFETVFTGQNGCDSTVILTVTFVPLDTTFNASTTCDSTAAGVFTNTFLTPEGCDSVVIETIVLQPSDLTELFDTSCDPNSLGVFETLFMNQFGCDSMVILTIDFAESDTTEIMDETCDPMQAGIFETLLTTAEGCDSLVIETIVLVNSDTTEMTDISCNFANTGIFETVFTNQNGCDSTVILTVTFVPIDTTFNDDTTCDPMQAGVFTNTFTTSEGCDSVVVETFTLLPSNEVNIDLTSCEPLDTGTVVVLLVNQFGCDSTVITTTTLLPLNECGVQGSLAGSLIGCDETTGSLTLTITEGTPPFSYEWTGPNSGMGNAINLNEPIEILNLSAGSYAVEITDANGFSTAINAEIEQIFAPNAFAEIIQEIGCFGDADGVTMASASGGQFPYTYLWSTNQNTVEVENLAIGTYSVTVTDANDCTDEATVSLSEPTPIELIFTFSNIDCFGQNEGFAIAETTGGQPPIQYSLNGGDFQNSNSFFGLVEGVYQITAQDANGCSITEAFAINAPIPLEVNLGDDLLLELGDNSEITALVNYPFESLDTIIWSGLDTVPCENCLTQPIVPIVSTTISVTVQAANGCTDTDNLVIFVNRQKEIFAPNIFSPNGDGDNELFYLFAKGDIVQTINSFLVFDRWGETVHEFYKFEPNDPVAGWDGTYRGQALNPAVFIWVAEIEFIDGVVEVFSGDVVLVR